MLIGGLVISTLPDSSALAQAALLQRLRGSELGRMTALAVVVTGLGLYAAAWLALCRHVARVGTGAGADALALVRRAAVVWSAPLLLAPPLFSRDGWSYAAQGTLAHFGISPYEHGPGRLFGPVVEPVDPRWLDTPAPYGPIPLMLGDVATGLSPDPWPLVVAHRAVALLGLAMLAWAVPRLARWTGSNPALASALVLCSPLMLAHGVGGLHNDLLMVGLMALALVLTTRHGWFVGAAVGGLAAAVKLPGAMVCVGVALIALSSTADLSERVRRFALVGVVSVAALLVPGIVSGLGAGWLGALAVPGTVRTPLSMPTVVGQALDRLASWAGLGLGPDTMLDAVRVLATLALVGAAAAVALSWRPGDRAEALRAVAVVTGLAVALSPVVHLWYLLWAVPFVGCLRLSRFATTALIAVSVVAGVVAPLDSSLHGAYLAIITGSMTAVGVVLVSMLTPGARERIERIATAEWVPVGSARPGAPERGVLPVLEVDELVVGAELGDPTVDHHRDPFRVVRGVEAVRDRDDGSTLEQRVHRPLE